MPFIPHTETEIKAMLDTIGVDSIDSLFDEVPKDLHVKDLDGVPEGLSEMEVSRLMHEKSQTNSPVLCFVGAGAYEHHIPAVVWDIATRGEFYSAYTPYQAEASQGTLQLLYEYQTMMANLTAMDVSNASLYDGASSLAEAVLMAVRSNRSSKAKRILIPRTVHPHYRKVVQTIVRSQGIQLEEIDFEITSGHINPDSLSEISGDITALVIPQPNFFGVLEEIDALTDWAHLNGALVIAVVNPIALALLKPPGQWGKQGADIVCGEGQPLGIPMSSGGPYFGFMCCKQKYVRQMPGRIVGRTVDYEGAPGYTLTLQAREQHIRRSKATSNICTNQGLMVTAATIFMSLLGVDGLRRVSLTAHQNLQSLVEKLSVINGVKQLFNRPVFHEAVLKLENISTEQALKNLAAENILGGYSLKEHYPELGESLLICATETKTESDINLYEKALTKLLQS